MRKRTQWRMGLAALLVAAWLGGGCATSRPTLERFHYSLTNGTGRAWPDKLVLVPVEVQILELSAGGVIEEVPGWSYLARTNITSAIRKMAAAKKISVILAPGDGDPATLASVKEHVALYDLASHALYQHSTPALGPHYWPAKAARLDYTVGAGLRDLRQQWGADAALIVTGESTYATGGRKATAVAAAFLGVELSLGHSYLHAGVVDLETGDILWTNVHSRFPFPDLRRSANARLAIEALFSGFPPTLPAPGHAKR